MDNTELIIKTLISELKFEKGKLLKLYKNLELLNKKNQHLDKPDKFDVSAYGYILHNFYNGVENIFKNIIKVFGNNLDKEQWHIDLLKKMMIEVEDIRPSVISENLFLKLIDYKNFRHFFRHAYLFELDWDKMENLVNNFKTNLNLFLKEIDEFIFKISE
jgi:hypothetical protein